MTLGIGIIGYGGMAGWHHLHLNELDGFDVVAAYDIDEKKVQAAEGKGLRGYRKLSGFLNDPDVDLVIVATPNDVHMELSIAALTAGKPVICEKPVALSVRQLDEMIATARRNNVLFTVHQNRRWDKDFRIVKQALERKSIGEPYIVESRVHGPNGVLHGWRAEAEHGGGMLLDWGVHLIDQILWMHAAPVKSVSCITRSVMNPGVDDYFRLQIEFADNLLAHIEAGTLMLEPLPRWYVCGDRGNILINDFSGTGKIAALESVAKASNDPLKPNPAGPTRTFGKSPTAKAIEVAMPDVNPNWTDFYRNVKGVINGVEELIVRPTEVRRVLRVIEMAFASASSSGQQIVVDGVL